MNLTETKMVELLKELGEKYSVVGVKAEFEAEGTRTEELMRLKEICLASSTSLTLKIGGCEAVRDMYDARAIGVDHLVAPMIETPFALSKYLKAIDTAFPEDEQGSVEFLINIETIGAAENFADMLKIDGIEKLNGIVVGRSDLIGSMGLDKKEINSRRVLDITKDILTKAKGAKMTAVVGGTISVSSLPFLKELSGGLLDRYETRKVCFSCDDALKGDPAGGLTKALAFELLWLQNKQNYYKTISEEDNKRICSLMERCK